MKRCVTILAAVSVVAVTMTAAWFLVVLSQPISKRNFDRLTVGMTLSEVEAILGGPARNESTGALLSLESLANGNSEIEASIDAQFFIWHGISQPRWTLWICDSAQVAVQFDDYGRLSDKGLMAVRRRHEGRWEIVRRWLRM